MGKDSNNERIQYKFPIQLVLVGGGPTNFSETCGFNIYVIGTLECLFT